MRLPLFSSILVFVIWLAYEIRKHRKMDQKPLMDFLEREREADRTPEKPLDDLVFIEIPWETLPVDTAAEDPEIGEVLSILEGLRDQKIANLTGYSNTDLKLKYGAPRIYRLMQWDQNYTVLARTLQKWGKRLMDLGFIEEGACVLEFAVATRTDVLATYRLLLEHYRETGNEAGIRRLQDTAEGLESLRKEQILALLYDQKTAEDAPAPGD